DVGGAARGLPTAARAPPPAAGPRAGPRCSRAARPTPVATPAPAPRVASTAPNRYPRSVLIDSPLWTMAGVFNAPTQPKPSPVTAVSRPTVAAAATAMPPSERHLPRHDGTMKHSARAAGAFTSPASVMRTAAA